MKYVLVNAQRFVTVIIQSDTEPYVPPGLTLYVLENDLPLQPAAYYEYNWDKQEWEDTRTIDQQWDIVKQQRDTLLQQSDYTQLPDVPLDNKPAWATYRQELRDVTNQPDPFNIVWPIPPN